MVNPSLQLRLTQKLALAPQLQQAIRLLQLNRIELREYVQEVLDAMQAEGIEARDLQTSGFSIQPRYVYPPARPSGEREPPKITGLRPMRSESRPKGICSNAWVRP